MSMQRLGPLIIHSFQASRAGSIQHGSSSIVDLTTPAVTAAAFAFAIRDEEAAEITDSVTTVLGDDVLDDVNLEEDKVVMLLNAA